MEAAVSLPLAFSAGLVSFLSPCVLPVVPSYVAFVSGLTLEELQRGTSRSAQRRAVLHSVLFVAGFAAVFMTLGCAATAAGQALARILPWLNRVGGLALLVFGLYLTGLVRLPGLEREWRFHFADRPSGWVGSFFVGVTFGAGWTPCVGPVLASILLYASVEGSRSHGLALLATYALGLGIPFVGASAMFNGFLASLPRVRRWTVPLGRAAGAVLALVGLLMLLGTYASLVGTLAGMGQLIDLEVP